MSSAREEILGRIRQGLGRAKGNDGQVASVDTPEIARNYIRAGTLDLAARLNLLEQRLRDYDAGVYRCQQSGIPQCIAQVLSRRNIQRMLIPPELPAAWLPGPPFEFVPDAGFSYHELDRSSGVLTGCALAVALTGTIVLRHSSQEGRRALTLIPDYHLCVIDSRQVVETVPEGIEAMQSFQAAPITTISGPSATADIEMTRVKGVHGPRTLDVILVCE